MTSSLPRRLRALALACALAGPLAGGFGGRPAAPGERVLRLERRASSSD